jgi:hypothetical protein
MDAGHFTRIANDPSVRPWLGGRGPIDFTPILEDPANLAFASPHGGIVAVALGSGRYDIHTLFLEAGRGREALETARAVSQFLFTRTDCLEGRTTVPALNRAGRGLALRVGFERRFDSLLPWTDGDRIEAGFFSLTLERWALTAPSTAAVGAAFHAELARAKREVGSTLPAHPDDPVHDRMVGAAALLVVGGQAEKGVRFYNVWAQCAQYAPITLVRAHPPILDVVDAVVTVTTVGSFEVLRCREGRPLCPSAHS